MSKKYELSNLTKLQLKRLREDVVLGSLFLKDYENRYGLDKEKVCYFFDGYLCDLFEKAKEENNGKALDFATVIEKYDNIDTLYNWYLCCEW